MDIVGIGGANIDIHGKSTSPIVMRDSNPGALHLSCGGVTRNILENLSRLGCKTTLLSVVGDDVFGAMIQKNCKEVGIDTSFLSVQPSHRSSTYLSIMDDDGDMLVAMNDMSIIKAMEADFIRERLPVIQNCKICVCDGNLSASAIEELLSNTTVPVFCDPVSTAWAKSLAPFAHMLHTLKPNRLELEVLSGIAVTNEAALQNAVDTLLQKGLVEIYVTLGADGIYYKHKDGTTYYKKSRSVNRITNATGAGDAAMAGIIYGTLHSLSPEEKVHLALAAGIISLQGRDTINPDISAKLLHQTIKEYII